MVTDRGSPMRPLVESNSLASAEWASAGFKEKLIPPGIETEIQCQYASQSN
jgi:hypothetical protein